ncbi:MAG: hypothetical protein IJB96_00300, partial [Lachnospira sp.]|nr:hypothetical protein [Lachnospira sp.]
PVSVAGLVLSGESEPVGYIVYIALMAATILRYYADVEFRLNINYKRFFVYYLLISLGYLLGIVLFKMTGMWMLAMIIGEVSAVLYVVFIGHIFRKPLFEASDYIRDNMKTFLVLSGTEIIGTLVLNADRLLLKIFVDSAAVTVFYAATLIGKTIALVSMPLNSVIIGHLARFEGKMSRKLFCGFCAGGALLSLPVNLFCTAISYVFVQIMYPDVFDVAKDYFFIANLGQILYFISSTLTVVLLRFSKEKYQLVINVIYFIVFLILAVPMTYVNGVTGMAWAIVSANLFKILVIMLVGVRVMKGEES